MSCNFPVGIYNNRGEKTMRPCGSCLQCRLQYSLDWAVRCCHEAAMHSQNSFLTLTYNNDNLPKDGSIDPAELQGFMKRLRRSIEPEKVRFFGVGEYGKKLNRPHYHICLFGYQFPDIEVFKARKFRSGFGKYDHLLYISQMLQGIWTKGFSTVGELNFKSAAYCARYVTKKIGGKEESRHYGKKRKEFALMSKGQKKGDKGGIGLQWLLKYKYDVYPKDYTTIDGKKCRPPRYYDEVLKRIDRKLYDEVKYKRMKRKEIEITPEGESYKESESSLRQMQKEKYRQDVTKTLEREIENA